MVLFLPPLYIREDGDWPWNSFAWGHTVSLNPSAHLPTPAVLCWLSLGSRSKSQSTNSHFLYPDSKIEVTERNKYLRGKQNIFVLLAASINKHVFPYTGCFYSSTRFCYYTFLPWDSPLPTPFFISFFSLPPRKIQGNLIHLFYKHLGAYYEQVT